MYRYKYTFVYFIIATRLHTPNGSHSITHISIQIQCELMHNQKSDVLARTYRSANEIPLQIYTREHGFVCFSSLNLITSFCRQCSPSLYVCVCANGTNNAIRAKSMREKLANENAPRPLLKHFLVPLFLNSKNR